jgi:sigma-B regulation protein RsbU (phosphoserine phosphatase)
MAGFRMSLLAEIRNDFAIRAVMRKVNSLLYESTDRDKFVTAFYGVLDHKNRVLLFSNAGHNPPILLRADGRIEYLHEGGVALGVLPEAHYEERPIALRSGDVLVLYTDGLTEAESPGGELFGQTRLERSIVRLADRDAASILDAIVRTVTEWCGEKGLGDDLTLMVIRVLEDPPRRVSR